MNICPHCSAILPAGESRCPRCGAEYWEPDRKSDAAAAEQEEREEDEGCAAVLMLPLLLSLCVTLFLLLTGFVFNSLARFESHQFKLLWLGGSCGAGYLVFRLIHRHRQRKIGDHSPHKGGTPS